MPTKKSKAPKAPTPAQVAARAANKIRMTKVMDAVSKMRKPGESQAAALKRYYATK